MEDRKYRSKELAVWISSQLYCLKGSRVMDRYMNISDVITQLKTDTTITALLGTRIYERPLPSEASKEAGVFLTIKNLDETPDAVRGNPLLNFVFTGHNRSVTYDTLNNIAAEVFDYIRQTTTFNGFTTYKT